MCFSTDSIGSDRLRPCFKMAANTQNSDTIQPVFVQHKHLPTESDKPYTVHEICSACERKTGHDTILGAQRLGALWRVYPKSRATRLKLLLNGVALRGVTVNFRDKNPFIIQTQDGEKELKTTKLTIGNLPISFSNKEILAMIQKVGGKPRSELYMEKDRDENGGLTRWLTGRRFIYVEVPDRPLPARVNLGNFKASIYHFEQKEERRIQQGTCGRCLTQGHTASNCRNDVICLDCHKPGHRRGDPHCDAFPNDTDTDSKEPTQGKNTDATPQDQDVDTGSTILATPITTTTTEANPNHSQSEDTGRVNTTAKMRKSRPCTQQSTLAFPRSRSYTPGKRLRDSPPADQNLVKMTRTDAAREKTDSANVDNSDIESVCEDRDENTPHSVWG